MKTEPKRTSFRLETSLLKRLKVYAAQSGQSMAGALTAALHEYLRGKKS